MRQAVMDQVPSLGLTRGQYLCSDCRKQIYAHIKAAAPSVEETEDEATHPVDDTMSFENTEDEESTHIYL